MRSEATLSALIAELAANFGDIFEACRSCAVSPMFVQQWRKDDGDVHDKLLEAERLGSMQLESVAVKRAVHGVEKGVWYQGEQVGSETIYSDSLLTTLLKGRVAAYQKDSEGGNTFNGPTQINIMPRADSYDEWLKMRQLTDTRKTLPAPDLLNTIDAEFSAVPTPDPFAGISL